MVIDEGRRTLFEERNHIKMGKKIYPSTKCELCKSISIPILFTHKPKAPWTTIKKNF